VLINKKNISLVVLLTGLSVNSLYSQALARPNAWKKYRKEVTFNIGASGFLGDLGGRNTIGKDNSPVDLELAATRPALSAGFRYKLNKNIKIIWKVLYQKYFEIILIFYPIYLNINLLIYFLLIMKNGMAILKTRLENNITCLEKNKNFQQKYKDIKISPKF
jgi:hypothetical protein